MVSVSVQQFGTGTRYGLEKRVKTKSQKFSGLVLTFVEVTWGALIGGKLFGPPYSE